MEPLEDLRECYERKELDKALNLLHQLRDVNVMYGGQPLLHVVVRYCDLKGMQYLLEQGYDVRSLDECGNSCLHELAKLEFEDKHYDQKLVEACATCLMEANISTIRRNESGETVATLAVFAKNIGVLKVLLSLNKKIDVPNKRGNSPLYIACDVAKRDADSIYTYDVNQMEKETKDFQQTITQFEKDSPIYKVLFDKHQKNMDRFKHKQKTLDCMYEIVKMLMESGMDPDSKGENQVTPRELAQECCDSTLASIVNGTQEDSKEVQASKGMTIAQAILKDDVDALRALIQSNVDVDELYDDESFQEGLVLDGLAPLAIACMFLNDVAVEALLEAKASVTFVDQFNNHALSYCFTQIDQSKRTQANRKNQSFQRIVHAFVAKGFDVDGILDGNGNTLMNLGCKNFSMETPINGYTISKSAINLCLQLGGNLDISTSDGTTPLMRLSKCPMVEAENLLLDVLEAGATPSLKDKDGNTALMYCASNENAKVSVMMCKYLFEMGDPLVDALNNNNENAMDIALKQDNQELIQLLIEKG